MQTSFNQIVIVVGILSCIVIPVRGLDCYQCKSYHGWTDCATSARKVYCLGHTTDCTKVEAKVRDMSSNRVGHVYIKGCARTCQAHDVPMCRDGKDSNGNPVVCKVECCSGDYCNAGSNTFVSGFTIAMCVLMWSLLV